MILATRRAGGVTRSSRKEPARLIRPTPSHNAGKLPHVVVVLDAVSDSMASRRTPDLVDLPIPRDHVQPEEQLHPKALNAAHNAHRTQIRV